MADRLQRGRLSFRLDGQKLHGGQPLTRVRGGENGPWLLVETSDEYAGARRNPVRSQRNQYCPHARWTNWDDC